MSENAAIGKRQGLRQKKNCSWYGLVEVRFYLGKQINKLEKGDMNILT